MAIPYFVYPLFGSMNNTAVNMYSVSCEHDFSALVCIPRSAIAGSYGNCITLRNCHYFSKVAIPLYIPTSSEDSSFATALSTYYYITS